jgi:hypothetical protein
VACFLDTETLGLPEAGGNGKVRATLSDDRCAYFTQPSITKRERFMERSK